MIAIREAKRNNPKYRPHALSALGEISKARDDLNFMPDALSIVSGVLDNLLSDKRDEMDIDSGIDQNKSRYIYTSATSYVQHLTNYAYDTGIMRYYQLA